MKSIKPGRGPSMMSGVMCIIVGVFGVICLELLVNCIYIAYALLVLFDGLLSFVLFHCCIHAFLEYASYRLCEIDPCAVYHLSENRNLCVLVFRLSDLEFHISEIRAVKVYADLEYHRRTNHRYVVPE